MEEKACSGRQEDVFELDDIVEQGGSAVHGSTPDADAEGIIELTEAVGGPEQSEAQDEDIVELEAADIADAPLTLPGMEEEPAPEVAGALFPASSEAEEEPAGSEEVPALTAPAPSVDEEREAFLSLAAEMEARLNALAERQAAEARVFEERLAAAEQRFAELEAFAGEQERRHASERSALEERLAAAEVQNAELAARAESLEKQLVECSSFFLDDASFRLGLEGLVSAMLDSRTAAEAAEAADAEAPAQEVHAEDAEAEGAGSQAVETVAEDEAIPVPATEDDEEPEADDADAVPDAEDVPSPEFEAEPEEDDASEDGTAPLVCEGGASAEDEDGAEPAEDIAPALDEALSARISEITEQVGALEARVAGWELRCEQEAALAASRVIREEIAALRADAARTGR